MGLFFLLGKCVILVEHNSTVVLDTKYCITVRKLINAPSPCEVIIGGYNKTLIIDSLSAEKNLRKFFNKTFDITFRLIY